MNKTLGIVGGMGPLATSVLFKKIICMTEAKCDQEHLRILIDNNTSIPDRSSFILGTGENPVDALIKTAVNLEKAGADYIIMPCNTSHSFYDEIVSHINIPFLNMVEETAKYLKDNTEVQKVGLLATEGTYKSEVYKRIFEKHNIEVIKPSQETAKIVMKFIYGIKAGEDVKLKDLYYATDELREEGAQHFILGCTELSTAKDLYNLQGQYIDPLEIIAKRAITFGGKKVKED